MTTRKRTNTKLKYDPRNARLHPDRNKEQIRHSLEDVGPFRSIGVDGDNIVRAGNGVFEQATDLGLKVRIIDAKPDELIAVRRKDLKGTRAVKAALYDNAANETSEWDEETLALIKADGDIDFEDDFPELDEIISEAAPVEKKTANFKYQEQFGVIVVCKSEKEQQKVFKQLTKLGLECRVVNT